MHAISRRECSLVLCGAVLVSSGRGANAAVDLNGLVESPVVLTAFWSLWNVPSDSCHQIPIHPTITFKNTSARPIRS